MFQPLVSEERLLGVACIDVRLETLKNNFLADFRLSNTGFVYVLDREGGIIYHPEFLPQGNTQGEMFLTNIITDVEIEENYRKALVEMLSGGEEGIVSPMFRSAHINGTYKKSRCTPRVDITKYKAVLIENH